MIKHLAIIMDGNRRWAKKNGFAFSTGYAEGGSGAIKRTIDFALKSGIKYLSLYTFSLENFKRPQEEQNFIFNSMVSEGKKHLTYLQENNIKACFIGDRSRFPEIVMPTVKLLEESTCNNTNMQLNILFCYGAQQELVCAVKELIHKVKSGLLQEDSLTESALSNCLWTHGIPDPELIIRTGGAHRLSNFLLFQAAYSELYFLDCFWPEITDDHLQASLDSYFRVQRNFGV